MNEVKWIKITIDMFDNRKIKHLRKLPDGNNIVLIWVMLLSMAGRCNAGGMIFLTENIPYSPKMLADELDFEESTVKLALEALEHFGMIVTTDEGFLAIAGWGEYQNLDGMERVREQTKRRVQRYRENQKLLTCNVTVNGDVTQCNAIDKEEDKDIDIKENDISNDMSQKKVSKKVFPHDSKAFKCAVWLSRELLSRYDWMKPPDERALQNWADDIDKCNRIDGYEWSDISDVLRFSQEDKFWQENVRSGKTFRKQYESMKVRMK